jgi:hypothetical protein
MDREFGRIFGSIRWGFLVLAILGTRAAGDEPDSFRVSEPIVCKSVDGLGKYVRRDPPELTTFDKLIVYVEPKGFGTRTIEGKTKASFIQNGKVRPAGSKKVVIERAELLRFEPEVLGPGAQFYLSATVGFKNMPPGEYVLELETVDHAPEADRKVMHSVPFRIVKPPAE